MEFAFNNLITGIPVNQNQQEFVVGVFKISQILNFTKYTKRLIRGYDEENRPIYNDDIQREIENSRVEKIADFLINDPEATFPTNLVFHIPIQVIEKQIRHGSFLEIYLDEQVKRGLQKEFVNPGKGDVFITIIDGQHRLKGIEIAIERLKNLIDTSSSAARSAPDNEDIQSKLDYYAQRLKDLLNIDLVVTFFVDKAPEYQAMIFSTINRTQKRVSESLVYSLFGLTTEDSPQKTALQVVISLNSKPVSPFFNRIKFYGGEYSAGQSPPLSQAAMIKSIVSLISESLSESENDRFRKRKDLLKRSPNSSKDLPFRTYYATNADTKISDIFFYFFSAVSEVFVDSNGVSFWDFNPDTMKPQNVLQTTVGYVAMLRIMIDILKLLKESEKFDKQIYTEFLKKGRRINFSDIGRYPFTSISSTRLYLDLSLAIWPPVNQFDPRQLKLDESLRGA